MRWIFSTGLALLVLAMAGSAALAAGHGQGPPPPHPHMLLIGIEIEDGALVGFRKCVDLANNRAVPNNAHHAGIHTGAAGAALQGAGHAVVPGAPLTPWADCAALNAALPIPLGP